MFFRKNKGKEVSSESNLEKSAAEHKRAILHNASFHKWRYVGKATHDPSEKYPNVYYDCDRCGTRGIDRGDGIEAIATCDPNRNH